MNRVNQRWLAGAMSALLLANLIPAVGATEQDTLPPTIQQDTLPPTQDDTTQDDTPDDTRSALTIGEQGYDTLADAMAQVQTGQTITLHADIDLTNGGGATLDNDKDVILDLNGFTITCTDADADNIGVNQFAKLTLTGKGKIVGGTASVSNSRGLLDVSGELVMENGTIQAPNNAIIAAQAHEGEVAVVTIQGGTVEGTISNHNSLGRNSKIVVEGGAVDAIYSTYTADYSAHDVHITGGQVDSVQIKSSTQAKDEDIVPTLEITDTAQVGMATASLWNGDLGDYTIDELFTFTLPDGYEMQENSDKSYTMVQKTAENDIAVQVGTSTSTADGKTTASTTVNTLPTIADTTNKVTITATTKGDADTVQINLPEQTVKQLAKAQEVVIVTDQITIALPKSLLSQANTTDHGVQLEAKVLDKSQVTNNSNIPDGASIVALNLYKLDAQGAPTAETIATFADYVTVTMPYAYTSGKIPAVYHIDTDGKASAMTVTASTNTTVTFRTKHFSTFTAYSVAAPDDDRRPVSRVEITVSLSGDGDIFPNGGSDHKFNVNKGASQTFTIKSGEVESVRFNGDKVTVKDDKFTIKNITKDSKLQITFTEAEKEEELVITNPYTDLPKSTYGYDAILRVSALGLMQGYPDDTFRAQTTLSRAMVAEMLYRLEDKPRAGTSNFTDVPAGQWYSDSIAWASANGVVEGYPNNTFLPNQAVTREELATLLHRYAQGKGHKGESSLKLNAPDASAISAWAYEAVCWNHENGMLPTIDAGYIAPKMSATRADVAIAFDGLTKLLDA